jgi:hypothetical protein
MKIKNIIIFCTLFLMCCGGNKNTNNRVDTIYVISPPTKILLDSNDKSGNKDNNKPLPPYNPPVSPPALHKMSNEISATMIQIDKKSKDMYNSKNLKEYEDNKKEVEILNQKLKELYNQLGKIISENAEIRALVETLKKQLEQAFKTIDMLINNNKEMKFKIFQLELKSLITEFDIQVGKAKRARRKTDCQEFKTLFEIVYDLKNLAKNNPDMLAQTDYNMEYINSYENVAKELLKKHMKKNRIKKCFDEEEIHLKKQ